MPVFLELLMDEGIFKSSTLVFQIAFFCDILLVVLKGQTKRFWGFIYAGRKFAKCYTWNVRFSFKKVLGKLSAAKKIQVDTSYSEIK